jgi:hypothetical protein
MNALEVVQEIVRRHGLRDETFTLIAHRTAVSWRQRHRSAEQRIRHLSSGLGLTRPRGVRVSGRRLLDYQLGDLDRYRPGDDHVVSISSRLAGPRERSHLALMDLDMREFIPRSRIAEAISTICEGRDSWLLRTDRHYHVYGDFLLDEREWERWNARFQMSLALVDPRYTGCSLLWGCNLLRLNAGAMYQTRVPATDEEPSSTPDGPIVAAARELAEQRHGPQLRRGGEPVVNHLREVAELAISILDDCVARGVTVDDVSRDQLYACGYLHDCIEDTNTDYEDVVRAAGATVAHLVVLVSMDRRLPERARRQEYNRQIERAGLPARIVKLADLLSNLRGLTGQEDLAWLRPYLGRVERQLGLIRDQLDRSAAFDEAHHHIRRWRARLAANGANGVPSDG